MLQTCGVSAGASVFAPVPTAWLGLLRFLGQLLLLPIAGYLWQKFTSKA